MGEGKQKLVLMVTHGPENPELATIPFVMATTALASDIDVLMGFQGNGVFLAMKGMAEHVAAHGFPPIKDLVQGYLEAGGKMYVCGPCVGSRMITPQELVEGATVVGAATFVAECVSATNVLVY
ncbi:MAG TPA: DsrE family protein [Burkholderiales bacterium]|nr:DsrE family protein [Burkholderiales bacterium]